MALESIELALGQVDLTIPFASASTAARNSARSSASWEHVHLPGDPNDEERCSPDLALELISNCGMSCACSCGHESPFPPGSRVTCYWRGSPQGSLGSGRRPATDAPASARPRRPGQALQRGSPSWSAPCWVRSSVRRRSIAFASTFAIACMKLTSSWLNPQPPRPLPRRAPPQGLSSFPLIRTIEALRMSCFACSSDCWKRVSSSQSLTTVAVSVASA